MTYIVDEDTKALIEEACTILRETGEITPRLQEMAVPLLVKATRAIVELQDDLTEARAIAKLASDLLNTANFVMDHQQDQIARLQAALEAR